MRFTLCLLLGLCVAGSAGVPAQHCGPGMTNWPHPGSTPSILALITGSYQRPSAATWMALAAQADAPRAKAMALLHASQSQEALRLLQPHVDGLMRDTFPDSYGRDQNRVSGLEVAGVAELVGGNLDGAEAYLRRAISFLGPESVCRIHLELQLIGYLRATGIQSPLSPHYNGGFFNYLHDALHWQGKGPGEEEYLMAMNVVGLLYRLDAARQPLYLELLGDLLSKEPNRFNANYMAALAYLRAGIIAGSSSEEVYDRKAIFALEAPRQAEERFNQFRFTQLKKALLADVNAARSRQAATEAQEAKALESGNDTPAYFQDIHSDELSATGFSDDDFGSLPLILSKDKAQIEAREVEAKRYAGEVDLKQVVKKDSRFNAFAFFLILTIVGSVVFIWRRILKANP
jgi:hypothetical protein